VKVARTIGFDLVVAESIADHPLTDRIEKASRASLAPRWRLLARGAGSLSMQLVSRKNNHAVGSVKQAAGFG